MGWGRSQQRRLGHRTGLANSATVAQSSSVTATLEPRFGAAGDAMAKGCRRMRCLQAEQLHCVNISTRARTHSRTGDLRRSQNP